MIRHSDLCHLSRVFNANCNLGNRVDYRINEWLKDQIAASLDNQGQHGFGIRSIPPCSDCDGPYCTMNCGKPRP